MRILNALVLLALLASPALAADPVRVSASIACSDKAVALKLASAVDAELSKTPGLQIDDKLPVLKLVLYANKDVNDGKNPNGWSVAIAHVNGQGVLAHLNVAHLDGIDDGGIQTLAHMVVTAFVAQVPRP